MISDSDDKKPEDVENGLDRSSQEIDVSASPVIKRSRPIPKEGIPKDYNLEANYFSHAKLLKMFL